MLHMNTPPISALLERSVSTEGMQQLGYWLDVDTCASYALNIKTAFHHGLPGYKYIQSG